MTPLLAHGIQGRADLPVPTIAFYWAATIVLVVSFLALAVGWRRPLLGELLERRARALTPGSAARAALGLGRVISVALLALTLATALFGTEELNGNWAPIFVFVAWWIGIALLAATVGDGWRALHPVAAIARWLDMPARTGRLAPSVGIRIAFAALLAWTWLELVYPTAADVRLLAWLVAGWLVATLAAMRWWGVEETLDRVEPFAAYTGVLGGLAVLGQRPDGTLERRPPVLGTLRQRPWPGLAAFLGLLIGSVSYDGLSRTLWWRRHVADATVQLREAGLEPGDAQLLLGSLGLVTMVTLAIVAFVACAQLSAIIGRLPRRSRFGDVATAFAPSLVPIALAYVVAHYFSYVWFQSQQLVRLASDPFGRGWDVLGTSGFEVDYGTLSAEAIWIVQVGAIVIGHVLALILAHDRALELEAECPAARGVRSQWPMLALMVLYTIGGLYFLSEGLNA